MNGLRDGWMDGLKEMLCWDGSIPTEASQSFF